jgi:hypothetical protein
MEEDKRSVVNHFETGSNCQVFNGNITGCVFAMPGSTVTQQAGQPMDSCGVENQPCTNEPPAGDGQEHDEELFHFIHPLVDSAHEWQVHDEVKRLVRRQGIQEICRYLSQLSEAQKVLLPQNAEKAYNELVRLGMPDGEGYSLKTFTKYYKR